MPDKNKKTKNTSINKEEISKYSIEKNPVLDQVANHLSKDEIVNQNTMNNPPKYQDTKKKKK